MKKMFWVITIVFILFALTGCGSGLIGATQRGDVAAMQRLLDQGADINEKLGGFSNTPLHMAATKGDVNMVKLLLDRGADIDIKIAGGWTPLMNASKTGHVAVSELLIERGADTSYAIAEFTNISNQYIGGTRAEAQQGIKIIEALIEKRSKTARMDVSETVKIPIAIKSIKSDIDEIPAAISEPRENAYAIVIGIENYRTLPKSDYSRNDASLVKAYLMALGYQERNIDFIADERATKTDIEKSLEAWLPNRTTRDSSVFVYFSGHGAPEPATGEAYLVPYDGDPNYLGVTGYSLKRLYDRLAKLEAKEIIVVLDSCFSGSGGRSVLAKGARPLVMMAATGDLSSNMAVLTASRGSQISTSSPDKGHGVFTYYFLKAIKEGKKNLAEIYETIKPQVEDEAKQLNVQQSPSLNPGADKIKGRFSLRR